MTDQTLQVGNDPALHVRHIWAVNIGQANLIVFHWERTKWISQIEFREKYRVSAKTELRMRDELKLATSKFHSIVYYDDLQVQRKMTENSTYALK